MIEIAIAVESGCITGVYVKGTDDEIDCSVYDMDGDYADENEADIDKISTDPSWKVVG